MAEAEKPRIVGLNHVALEVGDIDEALAFYARLQRQEIESRQQKKSSGKSQGGAARALRL